MKPDYLVRAMAKDGSFRAFAMNGHRMIEKMRTTHHTSPVVTAALGRLVMAGALMGKTLKDKGSRLSLKVLGDGPIGSLTVVADSKGHVKGYAGNTDVDIPPKGPGKLDVGGAVGKGTLSVMMDTGLKEPYIGQVPLVSGEIAEDITYYYAMSEQTPSIVALGVLVDPDTSVRAAGGIMIQLMPDAKEETIQKLEQNLKSFTTVTQVLKDEDKPELLFDTLLKGMEIEIFKKEAVSYNCDCSKERYLRGVFTLPPVEVDDMINKGENVEIVCRFCGKKYEYTPDELKEMREKRSAGKQKETSVEEATDAEAEEIHEEQGKE